MHKTQQTSGAIQWPGGGFQWTESFRQELPAVRGIHIPQRQPVPDAYPNIITFLERIYRNGKERMEKFSPVWGRPWQYWGAEGSKERMTHESLGRKDLEFWMELHVQSLCNRPRNDWITDACIRIHGLAFALEVGLALRVPGFGDWDFDFKDMLVILRQAIADADDASYARAEQIAAQTWVSATPQRRLVCAHLFPNRVDWAQQSAAEALSEGFDGRVELLEDTALPVDHYLSVAKKCLNGNAWAGVFLQLQIHGEDALPALALKLDNAIKYPGEMEKAVTVVEHMQAPGLLAMLAERLESRSVRATLDRVAQGFPAAALQTAIQSLSVVRRPVLEAWVYQLAAQQTEALEQALATLDAPAREAFQTRMHHCCREEQPYAGARKLLSTPPWLRKVQQVQLPVVETPVIATPEHIDWNPKELEQALNLVPSDYDRQRNPIGDNGFPRSLGLSTEGELRLLRGEAFQAGDLRPESVYAAHPIALLMAPESVRLMLWNTYPSARWIGWGLCSSVSYLLATYGTAAIAGLVPYLAENPDRLSYALRVDSARLVDLMLVTGFQLKRGKATARRWLRLRARTVLFHTLPKAFGGKATKERDTARQAVKWLMDQGFEPLAKEVAQAYGPPMEKAVLALIAQDPLLALPSRMPATPSFVSLQYLPPPVFPGGEPMPPDAVDHLVSMLLISKLDAPYAGLAMVRETCTPASLDRFAWALFEQWLRSQAQAKDNWAYTALGLLGDDNCARQLSPLIRAWPSEGASARAVLGIDILEAIGTDVALMHLDLIATKAKTPALKDKARNKIQAIADARELTPEQLADRLVPRLGLDAAGTLSLDFGPRQFTLHFDEALQPFVKDASGKRLKDLPKPASTDDAARAAEATKRYKDVKKDAKVIGTQQVARMEHAMVQQRRWTGDEFLSLFLGHPVMRYLAVRLAWGVYDGEILQTCFRIAEDWTLADGEDRTFDLKRDAVVGIPHLAEMTPELVLSLRQIFTDYVVVQPFKQLWREAFALTAEEQESELLTRYAQRTLVTASVLNLVNKGWRATGGDSGGWISHLARAIGDFDVSFRMAPGTVVGSPLHEPKQKIPSLDIRRTRNASGNGSARFGNLHPVHASEILRDMELLAIAPN